MLKLKEIKKIIEEKIPLSLQESWDNSGLIIGDENSKINKVIVTLDVTDSVIAEAIRENAELIISHHPVIFDGLRTIDYGTPSGNRIRKLIKNDINVLSYHTNFDKAEDGTTDTVCKKIDLKNVENIDSDEFAFCKMGEITPIPLKEFIAFLKNKLNLKSVKYTGEDDKMIKRVAVASGAGSSFYTMALLKNADVFITGEVKHHVAIDCMDAGMAVIDAGHFETENCSLKTIYDMLKDKVEVNITKEYNELFKYM